MLSFENDYSEGCHPQVLEALVKTNMEPLPGYGSDHCFEFYSPTISKALAIERVLNYYQIPKKQSYGFGDGENDIEMFNYVKHSIAMGNASADVMAAADITTDTIENDGLAKILKVLIPN